MPRIFYDSSIESEPCDDADTSRRYSRHTQCKKEHVNWEDIREQMRTCGVTTNMAATEIVAKTKELFLQSKSQRKVIDVDSELDDSLAHLGDKLSEDTNLRDLLVTGHETSQEKRGFFMGIMSDLEGERTQRSPPCACSS